MGSEQPHWRGINHLALITNDMDATVRFYHGVLGARLVATIGTPAFRHYFFEFGPEQTVAFFEYQGAELQPFSKPAGIPDPRAVQFDHLSFNLPDEEALESLRRRLKERWSNWVARGSGTPAGLAQLSSSTPLYSKKATVCSGPNSKK